MNHAKEQKESTSTPSLDRRQQLLNEITSKLTRHIYIQLESQVNHCFRTGLSSALVDTEGTVIKRWLWDEQKLNFRITDFRPELASIHDSIFLVEINETLKRAIFRSRKTTDIRSEFVIIDRTNIIASLTSAPISVEFNGEYYEVDYPHSGVDWNDFISKFLQTKKKLSHPHDRAAYKRYLNEKAKSLGCEPVDTFDHPPKTKDHKSSSSESIKRLIEASRFEKSDIKDLLGITSGQLDSRLRGYTEFSFDEVKKICDLLEVSIDEAVRIGDMTADEFENSWVYRWRRKNLERNIVRIEVEEKLPRSAIAEKIGFSASWLSYVLNGKKRITSQASRQIEYALGMTSGALDTPPIMKKASSEINADLLLKLTKELISQIKEKEGIEMHSQEIYSTIIAVSQLYNSLSSINDGQLPATDAIDFSKVYDTLVLHLKLNSD